MLHTITKKIKRQKSNLIFTGTAAKRTMSNMINDYMDSQMPMAGQIVPVASNTFTVTNPQGQKQDLDMSSVPRSGSGPGLPSNFRKSTDMTDIDYNPSYNGRKITDMTDEIYNDLMEASNNVLNMQMNPRPGLVQYQHSNPNPSLNRQPSPRLNQYQYSNPNPVIPRRNQYESRPNHLVHPQQFFGRPNLNQNLHSYHGVPPQNRHRDQYRIASESDIITKGGDSQYLNADFEDDDDDIKSKPLPVSPVPNDDHDIYIKTNMRNHIRDRSMENDDANSTTSDNGEGEDDVTPSTGENMVYKRTRTLGGDDNDSGDTNITKSSEPDAPNESNEDSDNALYAKGNGNVILPTFGNQSRR